MAKRPSRPTSELVEAAQAFDDELHAYAQLAETLIKTPLSTMRQLERIHETLAEIGACEERLGVTSQRLAAAVTGTRDKQQELARQMIERLPTIKERNEQLRALMGEFEALGNEASALNARAAELKGATDQIAATRELATQLEALASRAEQVAQRAREAHLEELASQAHALHQSLAAACKKLQAAGVR